MEYVVMPKTEWIRILDAVREKTGRNDSFYCYEVANIILSMNVNTTTPYFYDVEMNAWHENIDNVYMTPDYFMSCPHCGGNLQTSYSVDGNPCETNCPHCGEGITLIDGACNPIYRTYILKDQVMDAYIQNDDMTVENLYSSTIPADAIGRTIHIIVNGEEYDPWDIMDDSDRYMSRNITHGGLETPLSYYFDVDANGTSGWGWQGIEMPTVSIYY